MSSNVSAILSELQAARADILALKSQVSSLESILSSKSVAVSAAPSGAGKPVKVKTERKKSDAPPTPWRLFADRVRTVLKDSGMTGKALGVECVQFCATLKEENADFDSWTTETILARRADWAPPEVSRGEAKHGKGWAKTGERRAAAKTGSAGNSVVSSPDDELDGDGGAAEANSAPAKKARKNPWEGLTPEQRAAKVAAMKAGKDAKKAGSSDGEDAPPAKPAKKAAADDDGCGAFTGELPAAVMNALEASLGPAFGSAPKNAATPKVSAAPTSASAAPVFKGVMLAGNKRYLVNMENGHAYHRNADGSQGEWAGLFVKDPKPRIDDSVPEPAADDDDLRFDDE
jgi:hypothetical protein